MLNNDLNSYIKQRTKLKVTHVRYTIQALANLLYYSGPSGSLYYVSHLKKIVID